LIAEILQKLLKLFNIPPIVVRYFRLSNKLSGLGKNNFPKELVPLNTKQLSRGMLNYTFFQHYPHWKLPYWAVRQYDINNNSFIPRSHLAVSVNVTHRNWTAIGNINCDIEPIVDPCGTIIPFVDGWSLECRVRYKDELIVPAYYKNIKQKLVDDLPIIETTLIEADFILQMIHYTSNDTLICEYEIINTKDELNIELELILAIRPFNVEGVSPINSIKYDIDENSLLIDSINKIYFSTKPEKIIYSNLSGGDSANNFELGEKSVKQNNVTCEYGFANASALYSLTITPGHKKSIKCLVNLSNNQIVSNDLNKIEYVKSNWQKLLDAGSTINIADDKLSSIVKSSLCTVLQFLDSDKITPGAAIYHQFWFRDAAFQLNILDKLGFHNQTKNIFNTFFKYQKKDGYFQSQNGEWDSNGQVLWMIVQHSLLSNDINFLEQNFTALHKSVTWIDKKRILDKKFSNEHFYGFLPKGLSAEHLGLADYYYWDNFWSIAGLKSFILICELLDKVSEKNYALTILKDYENVLVNSIKESIRSNINKVIPSAPQKKLDTGIIGTLSAVYPLEVLDYESGIFDSTIEYIYKNYFHKGLFFQSIIHSGGNPYITLHIAHTILYRGNRKLFCKVLNDVISYASPTYNYPEAIHLITGGGVIGDGHHGWASAEVLLAVRDAFVYEASYYSVKEIELIILSGICAEWFISGKEISIKDALVLSGKISISARLKNSVINLKLEYLSNHFYKNEKLKIILPFIVKSISSKSKESSISFTETETTIIYPAKSMEILFHL
jgi:hypothetical protein